MDVSVVVPCHNVEVTIAEQLDALAEQVWHGEWEVIVVDNLSQDTTLAIAESYAERFANIRVVHAATHPGLSYARNVGIEASAAEKILICDGDDVVAAGWVAALADALDEHELVSGQLELDRLNPRWLADSRGRGDETPSLSTFYSLFEYVNGGNMGMRRTVWNDAGKFNESIVGAEDMAFSLCALDNGVAPFYVDSAVLHYRYRGSPLALFRQGRAYGACRPYVARQLDESGRTTPTHFLGWRSWVWLVLHLPEARTESGRARLAWVAGNRVGHVVGSWRYRWLLL